MHNKGLIASTKRPIPFELISWEDCLNDNAVVQCEDYLKTAWGKRYTRTRLRGYFTG
jgi:putative endonuclease